jgi:hypothetical protein
MKQKFHLLPKLLFCIICFAFSFNVNAFFYKKNGGISSEPIGRNSKRYNLYLGAGAGFNLFQIQSLGGFFSSDLGLSKPFLNQEYTPFFIFYFGFFDLKRHIRHEFEFNYSVSATSTVSHGNGVDSSTALKITSGGKITLIDKYSIFSQKFSLFYNLIKQYDNIVSSGGFRMGLFFGAGIGITLQRQFLYSIASWGGTGTTSTLQVTDDVSYINPDIDKYTAKTNFFISGGLQFIAGMTFDITEVVVAQVRIKYTIGTKPFWDASLFAPAKVSGSFINSHIIALDMGILIRAL